MATIITRSGKGSALTHTEMDANFVNLNAGLDVVNDLTPQLGGDLDFQTYKATSFTSTGIDDNATSTAITIDASENVGIGPTSPKAKFDVASDMVVSESAGLNDADIGSYGFYNTNASADRTVCRINAKRQNSAWGGYLTFETTSGSGALTERMRIDSSGKLLIGYTSAFDNVSYLDIQARGVATKIAGTSATSQMSFFNDNGRVGYIGTSGTSASYSTSSDYRLKENVVPMTGSIDRLKALKPSKFNFIADPETTVDGFLAHEAQEVVPEAVHGTKDAMMDEEYEVTPAVMDGETVVTEAVMGTRSIPDYQGIDQSKLVPLLVASLQEAVAKIEALEARVTALEV
jgi:hypothetical protein